MCPFKIALKCLPFKILILHPDCFCLCVFSFVVDDRPVGFEMSLKMQIKKQNYLCRLKTNLPGEKSESVLNV